MKSAQAEWKEVESAPPGSLKNKLYKQVQRPDQQEAVPLLRSYHVRAGLLQHTLALSVKSMPMPLVSMQREPGG